MNHFAIDALESVATAAEGEVSQAKAPTAAPINNTALPGGASINPERRTSEMNGLLHTMGDNAGKPTMMSTTEIADVTDKRHADVLRDVRGMLTSLYMPVGSVFDDLIEHGAKLHHEGFQVVMDYRGYIKEILLDREHTMTLVTGYDVKLRKKVVDKLAEHERGNVRPMTTTETLIQMLQLQADVERRQMEQGQAIASLENKVALVEATQLLTSRPANSESITHIRQRIGSKFGLSSDVIDFVLRQSPYAPKPAGNVKNDHASADGSTYTVWWQKDVTAVFNRFVDECQPVTQFMHTHPFIDGRFRVARKAIVA